MLHLAIALEYDIVGIRWDPDRGANLVLFQKMLVQRGTVGRVSNPPAMAAQIGSPPATA
jgi:hypothetical protein